MFVRRILFLCTGNLCRSPMAEGLFRRLVQEAGLDHLYEIDSAGTHADTRGVPPAEPAIKTLDELGIDIGGLRTRRLDSTDFDHFDLIVAMDLHNYHLARYLAPPSRLDRVTLMMSYAPELKMQEVPDPYGGSHRGFDKVCKLLQAACDGLWVRLQQSEPPRAAGPDLES